MSTPGRLDGERRILVLERTVELAARLREIAGAGAAVQACPDIAKAEAHLSEGSWDVLVAGPSFMHRAGLRRLSTLHQRFPAVSVVLALTDRPRADLAEVIQVGADDLVPLHADDREVARALTRAARITRGRLGSPPAPARGGRVVTIASASGGCGKTFVATNAAEFLARTAGGPVVLLDLDLQFGEVTTALRLRPDLTIADALDAEAEGHDLDEHLDEYLLRHPDGFSVLAAPRRPAEADSITAGDVVRILDALRARGARVVIDTSAGLGELLAAAIDTTDHLFVLATPDRPSLVNLRTFLKAVDGLGMAAANVSVVLNKAEADLGLDAAEMALALGRRFEAVLPYAREVSRSINVGVPLLVSEPRSAVAVALRGALGAVLPAVTPEERPPAPEPGAGRGPRRLHQWRPKPAPPSGAPSPVTVAELPLPPGRGSLPPLPQPVRPSPATATLPPDALRPDALRTGALPADGEAGDGLPAPPPTPNVDPVELLPAPRRRPVRRSRPAATRRPRATRPCSVPPARSGLSRPSTQPLATTRCRQRGPPESTLASDPGPPGRTPRAGNTSQCGAVPARWRARECTGTSPCSPSKWLPRAIEESPFGADNRSNGLPARRAARNRSRRGPAADPTESPWRCAGPPRCSCSAWPCS